MDKQTSENTLKTCWLIICFSVGSHRGQKRPRNVVFAQAHRDAFLMDASKNAIITCRNMKQALNDGLATS